MNECICKRPYRKLIHDAGAVRVSAGAINKMNEVLTDHGMKIARQAVKLAANTGRKIINEDDIKLANER